ncbi:MAG: DUF2202 domain-containing protein [Candidatus Saccharimonadales bacterium]
MTRSQTTFAAAAGMVVVVMAGVAGYSIAIRSEAWRTSKAETATITNTSTVSNSTIEQGSATKDATESLLLYLIEEEKLAHDVYTKMYELYGAKVFGNILASEQTHQSRVLTLLEARNIADPRSSELGIFRNQELQTLYDQLIVQGRQSALEAYKVGVAIEEKDIADINTQLATATDTDVVRTLEDLRRGSENHLRAFNRQLR